VDGGRWTVVGGRWALGRMADREMTDKDRWERARSAEALRYGRLRTHERNDERLTTND
jgi:hypothetical protein